MRSVGCDLGGKRTLKLRAPSTQENGANKESLEKQTDAGPPGREGRE